MALYGVPSGILYGQNERVDELNERIQSRQFPDKELQPNLSSRPSMSKYDRFPIVGKVAIDGESSKSYELYQPSSNFNPGFGPTNGYFSNIEIESNLRNQQYKLQKNENMNVYVPHSNSELYNIRVPSIPTENPHPYLIPQQMGFETFRQKQVPTVMGNEIFHNHTRTQLRGMN